MNFCKEISTHQVELSLSARLLRFKHEQEFTENTVKKKDSDILKIKGTNCMISHALVKRNMTTQNIRQQTYFWQNQYLFFQHSSLTYATMKDNQNICSIKICWKHDKRKIHLHVQQHRQNTKNPEVWGKKCTKVLTDYWKNWAIYVQCKYGANTYML